MCLCACTYGHIYVYICIYTLARQLRWSTCQTKRWCYSLRVYLQVEFQHHLSSNYRYATEKHDLRMEKKINWNNWSMPSDLVHVHVSAHVKQGRFELAIFWLSTTSFHTSKFCVYTQTIGWSFPKIRPRGKICLRMTRPKGVWLTGQNAHHIWRQILGGDNRKWTGRGIIMWWWSYQPLNLEWEDGAKHKHHPKDGAHDEP